MMHHPNFLKQLNTGLTRASIPDSATLIVAFSGGPDSSALLAGLSTLSEKKCFGLIVSCMPSYNTVCVVFFR
jgi:tRNA(Ile)-lysidine synthase TilS/MesJ